MTEFALPIVLLGALLARLGFLSLKIKRAASDETQAERNLDA